MLKSMKKNGEKTIMSDILIIPLEGRIDSNNAAEVEKSIFDTIGGDFSRNIVFDATNLVYISSAGLRILMKVRKESGREVKVTGVSVDVYETFSVTGFTEILTVEKRIRELSVEGCEIIGRGFFGTVYRIDDETIVKVYNTPDAIDMIKNEQRMAKAAFVAGIPTAISFDMVKVGEGYGSVFEMLHAKTYNDLIIEDPGNADEIIESYVGFLKLVHETKMDKAKLPDAKSIFLSTLDDIKDYCGDDLYDRIKDFIKKIPDMQNVVHGDFQMKNVMLSDGEPMLIDMDTLSVGHPIFDLQGLYVTYKLFKEDEPDNTLNFLGISAEMADHIWDRIIEIYFKDRDASEVEAIQNDIVCLACVRFLSILTNSDLKNGDLGERRIKRSVSTLEELL